MLPGDYFQALFNFPKILYKKDSKEVSILIWTNFRKLCYYISNISDLLQKFHFPIEVVLNSLQTKKGLELVFRPQFWYNFLMKFFLLKYDINWQNFINRLCLLPKLLSEMYFLFYA